MRMAGGETPMTERNQDSSEVRLAALRAEVQRDVENVDVTDALTALVDALDGYQRRKPIRF
jgi:hypothetical protein